MKHVMIDIETLGNTPGSAIAAIGAVEFSQHSNAQRSFYRTISVMPSLWMGFEIDKSTVQWWSQQSVDARERTFINGDEHWPHDVLGAFSEWLPADDFVMWARGPQYDLVMLEAAYRKCNIKVPWKYNAGRDVRTLLAAAGLTARTPEIPHYALSDAEAQVQDVLRAIAELGVHLE